MISAPSNQEIEKEMIHYIQSFVYKCNGIRVACSCNYTHKAGTCNRNPHFFLAKHMAVKKGMWWAVLAPGP
jgi:hypothetical protein